MSKATSEYLVVAQVKYWTIDTKYMNKTKVFLIVGACRYPDNYLEISASANSLVNRVLKPIFPIEKPGVPTVII